MRDVRQERLVRVLTERADSVLEKLGFTYFEGMNWEALEGRTRFYDSVIDLLTDIQHFARLNNIDLDLDVLCQLSGEAFEHEVALERGPFPDLETEE